MSWSRWLTFNTVGLAGIAVQLSVLAALIHLTQLSVGPATVLAVEAAVLHNFFWHLRWTWRDRPAAAPIDVAWRFGRFQAVNGVVSLTGNIGITMLLAGMGMNPVLANLIAIAACSVANYAAGDLIVFRASAGLVLAAFAAGTAVPLSAQSPAALEGWREYAAKVDQRHTNAEAPEFFALDLRKVKGWRERAQAGEIPMVELEPPGVPDGKMHHWAGAVYVPGTSVDAVVKRLQDHAGRESASYEDVTASRLIERNGDRLRVFLRLRRDAGPVTVHYNTEHLVEYRRLGHRATNRSASTKIAELAEAGTPQEREKPPGDDQGFLWRLNAYWRYEQMGDGVMIECESVSLSRSVPFVVRPLVGPIANRIARESLARTLRGLRVFLS